MDKIAVLIPCFNEERTIGRLYRMYQPMRFYALLALCLAAVSTVFLIPVLVTYARTGLVPQFPTLIVCGFVYVAAIYSFFTGMILSSTVQKNRQDFEMEFIRCQEAFNAKRETVEQR